MNRVVPAVAVASLLLIGVLASAEQNVPEAGQQRVEDTMARLNLTDEQIDQVKPILQQSRDAQQAILSSYGIDPENGADAQGKLGFRQARAMKQEMDELRESTLGELQGVLNEQQMDEFKLIQEERRAEMRERIRASR